MYTIMIHIINKKLEYSVLNTLNAADSKCALFL